MQNSPRTTKIQKRQDHQDMNQTSRYLPETRPTSQPVTEPQSAEPQSAEPQPAEPSPIIEPQAGRRFDKTLRTKPLAMKVTPAFHKKLKIYAVEYEIDMVDIIEEAVALWISQLDEDKTQKH